MIPKEQFKSALKVERCGTCNIGIDIQVAMERDLTDNDMKTIRQLAEELGEALLHNSLSLDPAIQERRAKERADILALFPPPIYVTEVPNGYCSLACCSQKPWFLVTTLKGLIEIGWRKRVIQVDWKHSEVTKTAEELFPNEEVTKFDRMIHAWSYEAAARYIGRVLGS
jgi:hypothetical protein